MKLKQFNLEEWLQDKSRRVVTRDGREVRILCIDCGVRESEPILVEITCSRNIKVLEYYNIDGTTQDKNLNLFFAGEDEDEIIRKKLINTLKGCCFTHFNEEFTVQEALDWLEKQGEQKPVEWSEHQHKLLNYAISMTDDTEVKCFLESLRNKGQQDTLKDLPKWKKAAEHLKGEGFIHYEKHNMTPQYADTNVEGGEYYLTLDDLKTLPKEE